MTHEELIEELARLLDHPSLYMGGASEQSKRKARAILPIILRRELEAGKKVRNAMFNAEIKLSASKVIWDAGNEAIRALDVAAIIGDSHD